jgi:hypothetical protein
MATTDHLGRELEDDSNRPQTVEEFARERGNLTGVYEERDEQTRAQVQQSDQDTEQRRQSTAEQRTDSDRNG